MSEPSTEQTLWARWLSHAVARPDAEAVVHVTYGEPPVRWTWKALIAAARRAARRLAAAGVEEGHVVALLLRHHPEFYPLYLGVTALGAIPSVLAYPNARLHPDKFTAGLMGMAQRSGLDWVMTERALEGRVRPLVTAPGSSVREVLFPLEWIDKDPGKSAPLPQESSIRADAPALLQHSSGTTGLQKAVVLSHRAVLDHVARYGEAIALSQADKVASWLPLYHDMGLIAALHLPLAAGVTTVQLDPFEWIAAPFILLDVMASERATLAWLPNFAYNLTADRVADEDIEGQSLASVRLLINCSEPVRADSHAKMAARFSSIGLREEALSACYAMAETTFAVTQTKPGSRAREVCLSREALTMRLVREAEEGEPSRTCVSSGAPIRGCEVTIRGDDGRPAYESSVGEVWIRSESMFDGYRNDPEKTREALCDGWYRSGDLGFLLDGELYVVGRRKDTIIVAGKNLYPEDIEDAVSTVAEITPGRAVAFGVEDVDSGTEQVCVVAETGAPESEHGRLRIEVQKAGMAIDVTLALVLFAPPRWLVKSSSGKLSRRANKERVLSGELKEQDATRKP